MSGVLSIRNSFNNPYFKFKSSTQHFMLINTHYAFLCLPTLGEPKDINNACDITPYLQDDMKCYSVGTSCKSTCAGNMG